MPWRRVSKTKGATSRGESIWVMSQVQPSPVSDFAAAEGAQRERWLQCLLESVDHRAVRFSGRRSGSSPQTKGGPEREFVRGLCQKTRKRHAVREMEVDPSEPLCRRRLQTAMSCFGQKPRW